MALRRFTYLSTEGFVRSPVSGDDLGLDGKLIVSSAVASGQNAIEIPSGTRIQLGTGANNYIYGDPISNVPHVPGTFGVVGNLWLRGNTIQDSAGTNRITMPGGNTALFLFGNGGTDSSSYVGVKIVSGRALAVAGSKIVEFHNSAAGTGSAVASIGLDGAVVGKSFQASNGSLITGGTNGVITGTSGLNVAASSFSLNFKSGWGLVDNTSTEAHVFYSTTVFATRAKIISIRNGNPSPSPSTLVAYIDALGRGSFESVKLLTGALEFADGTSISTAPTAGHPIETGRTELVDLDWTLPASGADPIAFDSVVIDSTGSGFASSTDAYEVQADGYYHVSAQLSFKAASGAAMILVSIRNFGSGTLSCEMKHEIPAVDDIHTLTVSAVVSVTGGQALGIHVQELSGTSDVVFLRNYCNLSIHYIGAA